jgi:tetratricopeptide (TPR) repeat protein
MQGSTRIDELRQKFHENPRRYFAPLANEYRKAGDPEQAIAICRAHLAQQPGHMSGHVVYGQALHDAKRTEEARVVFEKALSLDPDNAIVLRHLGDIAREKGENAEARHWYTRALDADPQDREIAAYIAELTEPLTEGAVATPEVAAPAAEKTAEPAEAPAERPLEVPVELPVEVGGEERREESVETVAPEAQPTEEAAPEEEVTETEVPLPEPSREPEVSVASSAEEPEPAAEVSPWRKTPPHEESPFVTRTMAELYAKQGYREAALDVYRQLALQHPDDKEIFDRIEELELNEKAAPVETVEHAEAVQPNEPAASEPEETKAEASAFPEIVPVITDAPVESGTESFAHFTEESLYAPPVENLDVVSADDEQEQGGIHFTEMELASKGDSWDTDSWGSGFSADDEMASAFESPDVQAKQDEPAEPPRAEVPAAEEPVAEAPAAEAPSAEAEPIAPPEPVEAAAPMELTEPPHAEVPSAPEVHAEAEALDTAWGAAPVSEPVLETVPPEPEPFEPVELGSLPEPELEAQPEVQPETEMEPEPEPAMATGSAEPQFLAYSPPLPEEKDLPHFAPKGPTVREFFATLGAFQPPSEGGSITAHAAVSRMAPQPDYPLATDAFANLFAGSEVSEEDSRAAFALSGALAATTPPPPEPVVPAPQPEAPPVASPAPAQESEEDIRKFREWLDGLTES